MGLDLLDGTPILDIKPYIPAFDSFPEAKAGWMDAIDGGKKILLLLFQSNFRQETMKSQGGKAIRPSSQSEG